MKATMAKMFTVIILIGTLSACVDNNAGASWDRQAWVEPTSSVTQVRPINLGASGFYN